MSGTGFAPFTATIDKTNQMLHEIEKAFGWPRERRNQSYAALRGVLHALRDRLTVHEAAQLGAQLPMLVRGVYYEGWRPADVPIKMHHDEFVDRVRHDFVYDADVDEVVRTVLKVLRAHITDGEWEDVKASMPKDLADVLP
jgi:uncharacterized protein (DUF2267 family)